MLLTICFYTTAILRLVMPYFIHLLYTRVNRVCLVTLLCVQHLFNMIIVYNDDRLHYILCPATKIYILILSLFLNIPSCAYTRFYLALCAFPCICVLNIARNIFSHASLTCIYVSVLSRCSLTLLHTVPNCLYHVFRMYIRCHVSQFQLDLSRFIRPLGDLATNLFD